MKFEWNPLKFGDALGLTYGPLSGRAPGKLTDSGLDLQQIANPFVSRHMLEQSNNIAPYIAAAIATMGGSSAGSLGAGEGEALGSAPMTAPAAAGGGGGTGAFDMGGSAGVFDSQGMPLYHSPAAAGMTPYQKFAQLPHMNYGGGQQPQMIQTPIDQSMEQGYQQRLAQMMRGGGELSTTTNFGYGPKLAQAMWT